LLAREPTAETPGYPASVQACRERFVNFKLKKTLPASPPPPLGWSHITSFGVRHRAAAEGCALLAPANAIAHTAAATNTTTTRAEARLTPIPGLPITPLLPSSELLP
jgi:hypothetical protein